MYAICLCSKKAEKTKNYVGYTKNLKLRFDNIIKG